MDNVIFSVVVPYKGRFGFVRAAISSVLNQDGVKKEEVEILAIDDPLRERQTQGRLKKIFPDVRYLDNEDKEGPGGKRNTGLKYAKGEYIVFLDSDDRLTPDFLAKMRAALNGKKNIGALCLSKPVYEEGFSFIERGKLIPMNLVRDIALSVELYFNHKNVYPGAFYFCQLSHMLFKRKFVRGLKFNYDYRNGGEDWDFFVQTLKKGLIRILPEKLIIFRYSPGSSTSDPINRIKKWASYRLLISRLPGRFRTGIFYRLLLIYIDLYGSKNAKK